MTLIGRIRAICEIRGLIHLLTAVSARARGEFLLFVLESHCPESGLRFLRVCHWGPSRLREFINKYVRSRGLEIDADAAFNFVRNSLAISDLPITPIIATLYLRAFTELGNQMTGLSFIRLLERLEERNLDVEKTSTNYSLYNLRLMLRKLAVLCFETEEYDVPIADYSKIISEYFSGKLLDVDVERFLARLAESEIVTVSEKRTISFSCGAFLDFYLAQALETGELSLQAHMVDLDTALCLGDAMAFYAGMEGEDFASLAGYLVTIGGQLFLYQNIGSSSLRGTIEELLKTTNNAFKQFLLYCLYADLRLPSYASLFESFVATVDNPSLIEMCYVKIYELMLLYEGNKLPAALISAFNRAFERRQLLYGKMDPIDLHRLRDRALQKAKLQHAAAAQVKATE